MKIINVEKISDEDGDRLQIETDHAGEYKFIFIDANDLIDIANFTENL